MSSALADEFFPTEPPGEPLYDSFDLNWNSAYLPLALSFPVRLTRSSRSPTHLH